MYKLEQIQGLKLRSERDKYVYILDDIDKFIKCAGDKFIGSDYANDIIKKIIIILHESLYGLGDFTYKQLGFVKIKEIK